MTRKASQKVNCSEQLKKLLLPLHELTPDPENARLHSEENKESIKASLERFGFDQPLVAQKTKDGKLIIRKGNGRYNAALSLGWTHAPVIVIEESDAEAIARAVADNRSSELGEWDFSILASLSNQSDFTDWFDADDLAVFANDTYPDNYEISENEWQDMPEFDQEEQNKEGGQVVVHFRNKKDREDFFNLIQQTYTDKTKSIWHPKKEIDFVKGVVEYAEEEQEE